MTDKTTAFNDDSGEILKDLNRTTTSGLLVYLRPLLFITCLALIVFAFWDAIATIAAICMEKDDYSHGLVLPFVGLYVLWMRRNDIADIWSKQADREQFIPGGGSRQQNPRRITIIKSSCYFIFFISLFTFLATEVGGLSGSFIQWALFFPLIGSFFVIVLPLELAMIIVPPVMLNFMAKPIPDVFVPKLFGPFQTIAAHVSAKVLYALNVPVLSEGNVIEIPGMRLLVEEACSGMRSLMALMTVALIVILLIKFPVWAKLFIFFLSIILAIVLNVFRVAATGVLAHFVSKDSATGFFHTFSGMIVFCIGLVILYYTANKLELYCLRKKRSEGDGK